MTVMTVKMVPVLWFLFFWVGGLVALSTPGLGLKIHGIPIQFENKTSMGGGREGRRLLGDSIQQLPQLILVEGDLPSDSIVFGSTADNVHLVALSTTNPIHDDTPVAEYLPDYKRRPGCCRSPMMVMALSEPSLMGCVFTRDGSGYMFMAKCDNQTSAGTASAGTGHWDAAGEICKLPEVIYVDEYPRIKTHKPVQVKDSKSMTNEKLNQAISSKMNILSGGRSLNGIGIDMTATILFSDVGLDPTHCQLPDPKFKAHIYGFTNLSTPFHAHGTATTSTGIGRVCAGDGGVVPGGSYAFLDMTDPNDPNGMIVTSGMFEDYIVSSMGVHVHSASWALLEPVMGRYGTFSAFIDYHIFHNPGVAHFYAVGNDGLGVSTSQVGASKNVLTVGALEADGSIAEFTSTGNLLTGRKSPTLYAPGVDIPCAASFVYPPGQEGHSDIMFASGTSLACPMMAAKAQVEIERRIRHFNLSIVDETLVRAIMLATPKFTPAGGLDVVPTGDLIHAQPINSSSWSSCYVSSGNSGPITISMAWADPPGIVGADTDLVNDLDIVIQKVDESGDVYLSQNKLSVHEKLVMSDGVLDGLFRIIVYPFSKKIVGGPIRFSIHSKGGGLVKLDGGCGMCFPGDLSYVGCATGEMRQCLPSGLFTECSTCGLGMIRNSVTGQCQCRRSLYSIGSNLRYFRGCSDDSSQFYQKPPPVSSSGTVVGSLNLVRYLSLALTIVFAVP